MSLSVKITNNRCEAACVYCLPPGTPVLMAGGAWKPIEAVMPGEVVVAFENEPKRGFTRKLLETRVTGIVRRHDSLLRIRTTRGEIRATANHEWLVERWGHHYKVRTDELRSGDSFCYLSEPILDDPTQERDYQLGWLAGAFVGDGTLGTYVNAHGSAISSAKLYSIDAAMLDRAEAFAKSALGISLRRVHVRRRDNGYEIDYSHITGGSPETIASIKELVAHLPSQAPDAFARGWVAGFFDAEGKTDSIVVTQKDEAPIEEFVKAVRRFGFDVTRSIRNDGISYAWVNGGIAERVRFASFFRPALTRKVSVAGFDTRRLPKADVIAVEPVAGEHEVYDLQTEALTYVANGFLTWDCYEHALRDAGPSAADRPFRMEAVMAQIQLEYEEQTKQGEFSGDIYLHGGEALTAGHEVVEAVMRKAFELTGHTNIQTYGYLIDKRYIEIFKRYKASVGISIDGPWPLNKARVVPGKDTREITETVMRNIVRLRAEGIEVSVIVVLHKLNALPEPRKALKDWILWLKDLGVTSGRLNLMHADYHRYGKALELTEAEAEDAWRDFFRFTVIENDGLYWQPFRDAIDSLLGLAQGTCVFGPCPYYHAAAEPVILSDGHTANCLKTAKTGHMYPRYEQSPSDLRGFGGVRYEVLPRVPQDAGGCQGCRYWRNCTGGCPSEGIGGDWRNKTRFCRAYYALFEEAETYLRRILPNARLTTDAPNDAFPWPNSVQGMREPALRYLLPQYTQAPSSWRGEAVRKAVQVMQVPARPGMTAGAGRGDHADGIEHLDGTIRHLDSGQPGQGSAGQKRGDGQRARTARVA